MGIAPRPCPAIPAPCARRSRRRTSWGAGLTPSRCPAAPTIVDGGGLDRVFDIVGGTVPVAFSGLTVSNGNVTVPSPASGRATGGGINVAQLLGGATTPPTVTLTDVVLSGNRASDDGG